MEEQRKSSRWGLWVAVGLMLLPVVYTLSLGPAVWMSRHNYFPESGPLAEAMNMYYVPSNWLLDSYPDSVPAEVLIQYLTLWGRPTDVILVPITE